MRRYDAIFVGVLVGVAIWCLLQTDCAAQVPTPELPAPEQLEAECAPELQSNRRAVLAHDGQTGLWLADPVARCMLARYALLPPFARYVRLLEQRVQLADERDGLRAREVALASQEADAARAALDEAMRRAREAEEARDAWYRHPALWVAVGVVLAALLGAVGAYAVSAAHL